MMKQLGNGFHCGFGLHFWMSRKWQQQKQGCGALCMNEAYFFVEKKVICRETYPWLKL